MEIQVGRGSKKITMQISQEKPKNLNEMTEYLEKISVKNLRKIMKMWKIPYCRRAIYKSLTDFFCCT